MAVTGGLIAWIVLYETPAAQHVLLKNQYEDIKCDMSFVNGSGSSFTVAKSGEYRTRYNSPTDGFVILTCKTAGSKIITGPAGLFFVKGGLTTLTLNPQGTFELFYLHDTDKCRQCAYGVDPAQQQRLN